MDPDILIPLAGMFTGVILSFPIIRAVVNAIERKSGATSSDELQALRAEIRELRAAVEENAETKERILDLEERLDFAERLLTQRRNDQQLPQ